MKYIKLGANLVFATLFLLMAFVLFGDYADNQKVVAEVNGYEIKEKELQKSLNMSYRDTAIKREVNEILIKEEINRSGYKNLDKTEFKKAKKYYSLINNMDLNKSDVNDKLKEDITHFYNTLLLIKKNTVTDEEITKFWAEEKNSSVTSEYKVKVYADTDHNKLQQIEDELAKGETLQEIEKKHAIKFTEETIKDDNPISSDVSQLKPLQFLHSHNYIKESDSIKENDKENGEGHEGHDDFQDHESHEGHDDSSQDHESHEGHDDSQDHGSHAILILESIVNGQSQNLEDNKDEITDFYITKNFYKEKIELISFLKSKYKVKLKTN